MSRWMHAPSITRWRGKVKLSCACGYQTRAVPEDQEDDLLELHRKHTGITERIPRPQ